MQHAHRRYEDDRDEGEWFLYTGSGGRDLSGNKRTNKVQSFDQTFESMNKALKLSCLKGLPVRVVRSFKEKRSAYAPSEETPVRYDGVYRIVRCWRKPGAQGPLVCRYLFVRCDNEPAPWSSEGAQEVGELRLGKVGTTRRTWGGKGLAAPAGPPALRTPPEPCSQTWATAPAAISACPSKPRRR